MPDAFQIALPEQVEMSRQRVRRSREVLRQSEAALVAALECRAFLQCIQPALARSADEREAQASGS
jgi:hypothetical protein